jgi:beta-glucanase (GH16 family)
MTPPTSTPVPSTTLAPVTTIAPAPPAVSPAHDGPTGFTRLHWADEFDGSSLNTTVWRPYHNTYGDGNNELACLTPANVRVGGGVLTISARREQVTCPGGRTRSFTSGFVGTRETGTYFPSEAYFEVRAKVPHAQGMWPAFWLRHRQGSSVAEVDVMEYFHSQVPGRSTQTLHLDGRRNVAKRSVAFEAPTSAPAWQTWGVAIERSGSGQRFTFYTNGVATLAFTDNQATWATRAPAGAMFDIALNLAVGGDWAGHPDDPLGVLSNLSRCAQGGTYPDACRTTGIRRAQFPETYQVDYVRVFTR